MEPQVLLLYLEFYFDVERCEEVRNALYRRANRTVRPCHFGSKFIAFAIVTKESSQQLVDRLRPVLNMSQVKYWKCFSVVEDVVAKDGALDPLFSAVASCFDEIRKGSDPNNVRSLKPSDVFKNWGIPDSERSAAIKMALNRGNRDKPKHANQTQRSAHDILPEDVFRKNIKPTEEGR